MAKITLDFGEQRNGKAYEELNEVYLTKLSQFYEMSVGVLRRFKSLREYVEVIRVSLERPVYGSSPWFNLKWYFTVKFAVVVSDPFGGKKIEASSIFPFNYETNEAFYIVSDNHKLTEERVFNELSRVVMQELESRLRGARSIVTMVKHDLADLGVKSEE